MPYNEDMRRFIMATDSPLMEDDHTEAESAGVLLEEFDSFLYEAEERQEKETLPQLLEELRALAQRFEWHRELTESHKYNDGYELALAEAADRLKSIISKYDKGY